jgi:hypothetical protein
MREIKGRGEGSNLYEEEASTVKKKPGGDVQDDEEAFPHDVVQEPKVAAENVVQRLDVFDLHAFKDEQQRGEEKHVDSDEDFARGIDTGDRTLGRQGREERRGSRMNEMQAGRRKNDAPYDSLKPTNDVAAISIQIIMVTIRSPH